MSGWSFPDQKVKRSRVDRQCCGCGIHLPVGSSLVKVKGVFEGDFIENILCMGCFNFLDENADSLYDESEGSIDLSMIGDLRKKIVGNPDCRFNARSPHLRCAINPCGPCDGCQEFEPREVVS
jgi:hypothetical protein